MLKLRVLLIGLLFLRDLDGEDSVCSFNESAEIASLQKQLGFSFSSKPLSHVLFVQETQLEENLRLQRTVASLQRPLAKAVFDSEKITRSVENCRFDSIENRTHCTVNRILSFCSAHFSRTPADWCDRDEWR